MTGVGTTATVVSGELPDLLALYDPGPGRSVRGGMVLSADGGGSVDGRSRGLSTPADQQVFRVLRAHADVVLVGAGTARTEGYGPVELSPEHRTFREAAGRTSTPVLALVTRSLDVPDKALGSTGGGAGAIVISTDGRTSDALPDLIVVDSLADALDALAERGLTRVLCEGGPSLLGQLVAEGLLTELCMTLSPRLVGDVAGIVTADLDAPVDLALEHLVENDGSLLLRYRVAAPASRAGRAGSPN